MLRRVLVFVAAMSAACEDGRDGGAEARTAIRFLHTFDPAETELVNALVEARGLRVEGALVPFARGQQVISELLEARSACPDLIRIDATWLPTLRPHLAPVPTSIASLDWLPEAAELARIDGRWWGVPQTVDGLLVVRDAALPAPATSEIVDLIGAARAASSKDRPHPLSVRVDGYWAIPWLRAEGADLSVAAIEGDGAPRALAAFAALFGDVVPPPPPAGSEQPDELRRWQAGEIAYWVTGPWQLGALLAPGRVSVSEIARAPRGGQLLVVPTCAQRPTDGWRLATELSSDAVSVELSRRFGTIPAQRAQLALAPALAKAAYEALRRARPLPRDPVTPLLFDDLNPALAAVVAGDATAAEAIEGVRRGWRRLTR